MAVRLDILKNIVRVEWGGLGQFYVWAIMQKGDFSQPWPSPATWSIKNASFTLEEIPFVSDSTILKQGYPTGLILPPPVVQAGTGQDAVTAAMRGTFSAWRYAQSSLSSGDIGSLGGFDDAAREGLAILNLTKIAALNPLVGVFEFDLVFDNFGVGASPPPIGAAEFGATAVKGALTSIATPKDGLSLESAPAPGGGTFARLQLVQSMDATPFNPVTGDPVSFHFTIPKANIEDFTITTP